MPEMGEMRYPCREEPTRQPRFVHAGHVTYPTQRAHANVVFNAADFNAFVKLIGGDSMDPNLVHSDAAHFPEPSMVQADQSADKVCGEAPRLAAERRTLRMMQMYAFRSAS